MSRATDEVGRVQSRKPRYNHIRKNFSAIVGYSVTVLCKAPDTIAPVASSSACGRKRAFDELPRRLPLRLRQVPSSMTSK